MPTVCLYPREAILPATNYPAIKAFSGTNFPVDVLAFDAATEETCFFLFRAKDYTSGNLTIRVRWYADNASSGDVIFGAAIAVITPNTDSQDVETKSFATASTATDSHLGTTGQRLHEITITVSNLDNLAADDAVWLKFYRDADAGGDTLANDALVTEISVEYS